MLRKRTCRFLVLAFVLWMAMGCALLGFGKANRTIIRYGWQTLGAAAPAYEAGMSGLDDLYDRGFVSEQQKDAAYRIAEKYWKAYHLAVFALESYIISETAEDKKRLEAKLDTVENTSRGLNDYLNPILIEGGLEAVPLQFPAKGGK